MPTRRNMRAKLGDHLERLFAPVFARLPPSRDSSSPGECDGWPTSDLVRPGWLDGAAQTLLGSILDTRIVCFSVFLFTPTRLFTISLEVDTTL